MVGDNLSGVVYCGVLSITMSGNNTRGHGGPDARPRRRGSEPSRGSEGHGIQDAPSVWDVLVDTSSQMEAELRSEAEVERAELRHGESAGISLAQRLHACHGRLLNLQLTNGDDVDLQVADVSKHWVRGETTRGETLIQTTAIAALRGLPVRAGEWSGRLVSESTFQMALRAVMSEGTPVLLTHGAGSLRGRIVSVGADWVDLRDSVNGVGLDATNKLVTIPTAHVLRVDAPWRLR